MYVSQSLSDFALWQTPLNFTVWCWFEVPCLLFKVTDVREIENICTHSAAKFSVRPDQCFFSLEASLLDAAFNSLSVNDCIFLFFLSFFLPLFFFFFKEWVGLFVLFQTGLCLCRCLCPYEYHVDPCNESCLAGQIDRWLAVLCGWTLHTNLSTRFVLTCHAYRHHLLLPFCTTFNDLDCGWTSQGQH